jgi:hypothetical protein
MRSASLHALSDESIVFLPGPQNGKKAWEAKPPSETGLQWHPVLAATSTNGDFGYTTVPGVSRRAPRTRNPRISVTSSPSGDGKMGNGNYSSIWARIIRVRPRPRPELQLVENRAPYESPITSLPSMLALDHSYAADRLRNFSSVAEDSIRFYRPQEFPEIGKDAAATLVRRRRVG